MKSIRWINTIFLLLTLFFVGCKTDEIALKALDWMLFPKQSIIRRTLYLNNKVIFMVCGKW